MAQQRVSLKDVAREAGLSVGTVCQVLRGNPAYSNETSERVRRVANQLNYRPNMAARALVSGQTYILTLVTTGGLVLNEFVFSDLIEAVVHTAAERGYDIIIHTPRFSSEEEALLLMSGRSDGILFFVPNPGDALLQAACQSRIPSIALLSRMEEPHQSYVVADDVQGGRLGTEYLLSLGHRRIAFLQSVREDNSSTDRCQGYLTVMQAAGIVPLPEWEGDSEKLQPGSAGEARFRRLLESPQRPTAVFAYDDYVAFRAIQIAREMGLQVPKDLSVLGFDSTDLCTWSSPQICSLYNPAREIGQQGVQALIEAIEQKRPCTVQERRPVALHRRESCRPLC